MAIGKMKNLGTVMETWSRVIIRTLKTELTKDQTVASRKLTQSIQAPVKIFGNKYVMEITMEDYWKSVDQGTKPGTRPDVNKILRWMQHKRIVPKPTKSGLTKPRSKFGKKIFKDRRLALAQRIANAIYRRGTIKRFGYKGSGFATDYMKTLPERMNESIRKATGEDIKIQVINALK